MRFSREALLELEASRLAPYAQKARDTRGRAHPEPESLYRTCLLYTSPSPRDS